MAVMVNRAHLHRPLHLHCTYGDFALTGKEFSGLQVTVFVKKIGVPGRIRTCDLPLRRGLRYPAVPPGPERHGSIGRAF